MVARKGIEFLTLVQIKQFQSNITNIYFSQNQLHGNKFQSFNTPPSGRRIDSCTVIYTAPMGSDALFKIINGVGYYQCLYKIILNLLKLLKIKCM
jgi:hypothetical protein